MIRRRQASPLTWRDGLLMSCTNESSKSSKGKPKPTFLPMMNCGSPAEKKKNDKRRNGIKRNNFSSTDFQDSKLI